MNDRANPWLLHFTHADNIEGIIKTGLLADNQRPDTAVECAEPGIKQRRRLLPVTIEPAGVVADYVPFYFAPRSPMLHRIHSGKVTGYRQGQEPLVYLVTRLETVITAGRAWVASDRNAAVATARFTARAEDLPTHIDWEIMAAHYWFNTPEDGSRMQRRMAELLVHELVAWSSFSHVYTRDAAMAERVRQVITGQSHRPVVEPRERWYF
ncbi:type II toxin-antitoxin system toxin DNA ADP-ribosyl transferase DarT [Nonomuraea wenchangensis]|uniref:type II toxin-antitoxin system toxin DNA ADP-ribosyl transferase DarT n=1 Tax=Nonomuraea wenchangensis TaxID=568860 RepID=UPI0033FF8E88